MYHVEQTWNSLASSWARALWHVGHLLGWSTSAQLGEGHAAEWLTAFRQILHWLTSWAQFSNTSFMSIYSHTSQLCIYFFQFFINEYTHIIYIYVYACVSPPILGHPSVNPPGWWSFPPDGSHRNISPHTSALQKDLLDGVMGYFVQRGQVRSS